MHVGMRWRGRHEDMNTTSQPMPPAARPKFLGAIDMSAHFTTPGAHSLAVWDLRCWYPRCSGILGQFIPRQKIDDGGINDGSWEWVAILPGGYIESEPGCYTLGNHARLSYRHAPRRPRMTSIPSDIHLRRDAQGQLVFENSSGVRVVREVPPHDWRDSHGRVQGSGVFTNALWEGQVYRFECPRCHKLSSVSVEEIISRPLVERVGDFIRALRQQPKRAKGKADTN